MAENRVDVTLTPEDLQAISGAIATLEEKLPFLMTLTLEESRGLARMGDKSRAFVVKALDLARKHPEILPGLFQISEMEADLKLYEDLYPVLMQLTALQAQLADTTAIAGSEAYGAARLIYSYAKSSGLAGDLEPYLDDLGKRYRKRRVAPPSDGQGS